MTPPPPDVPSAMGFSFALHAGILLVAALVTPALGETNASFVPETESYRFLATLNEEAAAPPEQDDRAADTEPVDDPDDRARVPSRCGEEHGGSMGDALAASTRRRYGVEGPADNADPHIGRELGANPATLTVVGPPREANPWGSVNGPVEVWGRDESLGNDPTSARGNMWGVDIGEAFGSPGSGIGLLQLCATCGANGRGPRLALAGSPGGAIGTERASDLALR